MKINEIELESSLLNIEENHELYETEISIMGIKKDINSYKKTKLPSFHHFVETSFISKNAEIYLFPQFQPSTQINAKVKGYQEVFNGGCTIITCQMDEREFSFFESNFNKERYQNAINSQTHSIRLAAISISVTYRDSDKEKLKEFLTAEERKQIETRGYSMKISNGLYFYTSIMDVNSIEKNHENYVILKVRNPLDNTKELELIATAETFEDTSNLRQIFTEFYFIGSII